MGLVDPDYTCEGCCRGDFLGWDPLKTKLNRGPSTRHASVGMTIYLEVDDFS